MTYTKLSSFIRNCVRLVSEARVPHYWPDIRKTEVDCNTKIKIDCRQLNRGAYDVQSRTYSRAHSTDTTMNISEIMQICVKVVGQLCCGDNHCHQQYVMMAQPVIIIMIYTLLVSSCSKYDDISSDISFFCGVHVAQPIQSQLYTNIDIF